MESLNETDEIKIVDLVNLHKTDNSQFLKLFEEAHKIYCEAFPECEQEPKEKILDYIKESSDSLGIENGIGHYNYLVLVVEGIPKGMHSLDFISNNEGDLVTHLGPLAIGEASRRKGLSSILVNEIFKRNKDYAIQNKLNPIGLIGDIDLFTYPGEEVETYSNRLKFHHNHLGFGAAVIIDENNYAKLVPYGSPGIIKNGQPAEIMKFIMAITPFVNGSIKKISVTPGEIISPSGKLMVDKNILQKISKEKMFDMQKMIYDGYARPQNKEIYSLEQISSMFIESKKALQGVEEIYLIPIMDTRYL